jgi:hypothetical protein
VEDVLVNAGGGGSPYGPEGSQSAGGFASTSHGATTVLQAPAARGFDSAWISWRAAAPGGSPTAGSDVAMLGVGGGALGAGPPRPTCSPDWWSNAAAVAALGLEWLASVLTAATAPASMSIGNHATVGEADAAEGVSARRRGGRM